MESAPVSGVATRNATVAPGVAPCRRSPSAVGSTPHEHKGSGAPRTDAQSTDFTLPVPTSRVNSLPGTRTAITPARRKPKRRKTEASFRISHISQRTPNRKSIIAIPWAGRLGIGTRPRSPAASRCRGEPSATANPAGVSLRQVSLVQRAGHRVLRVDDVGDLDLGGLAKNVDRVVPVVTVVLHQPVDHVGAGEPEGVHQGPRAADGHDLRIGDHVRPVDLLALDQVDGEPDVEGGLDSGAVNLPITLSGVPIAKHEERARLVHREVKGDAFDDFVEVHVRAVRAGIERADAFLAGWSGADCAEERPDRNL